MQFQQARKLLQTVFAIGAGVMVAVVAGGPLRPIAAEDAPSAAGYEKAAHLERMRQLARGISVFDGTNDRRVAVKLVDRPVLAYRDDTRKQHDSTMWIFGAEGRPSAMIAIEHYPQRPKDSQWLFEIVSLSAGRISAERGAELQWQARVPGLALKVLDDANPPADKPATRLAQMRELRRRFTAHEREGTGGRIELLPLSAPLYRYQDPAQGVIDGAVFAFANGTNPEVLWIIEAHGTSGTPTRWQFGSAQMTGGEVFLALDGKEVWSRGEADPPAVRDSYVNGWMSAEKPE